MCPLFATVRHCGLTSTCGAQNEGAWVEKGRSIRTTLNETQSLLVEVELA